MIADSWYAPHIAGATQLRDLLSPRAKRLVDRSSVARGLFLAVLGIRADAVVTTNPNPGASVCMAVLGLLGVRRLVVLEYIVHPPAGRVSRAKFVLLRQFLLGRALLKAQVLTASEVDAYARLHRLPPERFAVVRWPTRFDDTPPPPVRDGRVVVASGRRTDWETFFRAAADAEWDVRVVCTGADLPTVQRLAGPTTQVLHDVSESEHQSVVNDATVYVIPVPETGASIGQIRVMNAGQAGVPVVAADVTGLVGYVDADVAVLVPPGNADELRRAVDSLLDDRARRERLRAAAYARGTTMAAYLRDVNDLTRRAVPG